MFLLRKEDYFIFSTILQDGFIILFEVRSQTNVKQ